MEVKLFEIRDRGTMIPVMAIRLGSDIEAERYLFDRAGYGVLPKDQREYVLLIMLHNCEIQHNPLDWSPVIAGRTMPKAHRFIIDKWDDLVPGQVICIETLEGERSEPKQSEAIS